MSQLNTVIYRSVPYLRRINSTPSGLSYFLALSSPSHLITQTNLNSQVNKHTHSHTAILTHPFIHSLIHVIIIMSFNGSTPSSSLSASSRWLSNDDGKKQTAALASAPLLARTGPAPTQPTESATSYFPAGEVERPSSSGSTTSSSNGSTTSSSSSGGGGHGEGPATTTWKLAIDSPTGDYPLPVIETPFPKPAAEIDVAAQLAKDPLPRSLHSSLKRAATHERRVKAEDPGARARALEEAKREWMSWKI